MPLILPDRGGARGWLNRLIFPLIFFAATQLRSVEPWSDSRLPVTNGVAAWFDLSRQVAARGTAGLSPLRSWNDAPDILLDASGHRRHLLQPLLAMRPTFRIDGGISLLAFDGTNDFLAGRFPPAGLTNTTVILVASPERFGNFRGFFSWNQSGQNDFTHGLNFDLGSAASSNLVRLNAEGAGFTGEKDLLGGWVPGPSWHIFSLIVGSGEKGVKLTLDGTSRGDRPRHDALPMVLEEFTLGARRLSLSADRPHTQSFFGGGLAEIVVFDRVLSESERQSVEKYLDEKYGSLLRGLDALQVKEGAIPLIPVTNPPPVQVHFPGFEARELPVKLGNLNNLRYRPDGKMLGVGYDGKIWLLSDRDGDGLEEMVEPFWEKQTIRAPIGAALTPTNYSRGQGVFLAAKEKVVLVVDTNGDDRADQEITVATWTEKSEQPGVDALGLAVGADGSVYFQLGAASFVEPFLIDRTTGRARYTTAMERGTIQRVLPDFSRRETICTGVRFVVGLAFNRQGDLFATDQEGATWRHDGNPFDELLHIQKGRHYGFPPRHPRHLPAVFDEPSVFDYVPQHQSTCGLQFNDRQYGGKTFGPAQWEGEALVSGYSRGKIWRTRLVKTDLGYVAQSHLLATLQALTVDATVSPRGDLLVATHSGKPDWGTGPGGAGKLWRIRYSEKDAPQPVATWNASRTEIKIAFDRPLSMAGAKDLIASTRVDSGAFVFPGDRFETIRPGYQVVYDQLSSPRFANEVLSLQLSPDRRTLSLVTRPRQTAINYSVTLPAFSSLARPGGEADSAKAPRVTELLTDLGGWEVKWQGGSSNWSGWVPHLDPAVTVEFTRGSAEHEHFQQLLSQPGQWIWQGQLDLWQMLQPAIQPGATIDWERPSEKITVEISASQPFTLEAAGKPPATAAASGGGGYRASFLAAPASRTWVPVKINLNHAGGKALQLQAAWFTDEDPRPRPFQLRRFLLPWALPWAGQAEKTMAAGERKFPELEGARWLQGRRLFFSDSLGCAKCHRLRGEGERVGPDLSNLIHRDLASIQKDLEFPNAAINPDHLASKIEFNDGDSIIGIIRSSTQETLELVSGSGQVEKISQSRVKEVVPATLSLMPEGIWSALSPQDRKDLLLFLVSQPLEPMALPPEIQGQRAPPPTNLWEKVAFRTNELSTAPWKVVLCASPKDKGHGAPGFHDYPLWRDRWSKLLGLADGVKVETADRWPSAKQWAEADVICFYHDNPAWEAAKEEDLRKFLDRGGGLVFLHWSVNAYRDLAPLSSTLGYAWGPGARFRYGIENLQLTSHEITAGLGKELRLIDESYWRLSGAGSNVTVLANSTEENQAQPQVWIRESGKGRIFVCIPGHFTWTFDDPLFRILLFRGICWAGRQPVDRLSELVPVGARLSE